MVYLFRIIYIHEGRESSPALDHDNVVTKIGLYKRRKAGFVHRGGLECKRGILERADHTAACHPAEAATSCDTSALSQGSR